MICRFYSGYTLESASRLTIKEFMTLHSCMEKIVKIENPTPEKEKPQSVSSAGFQNLVKKQQPKKRK